MAEGTRSAWAARLSGALGPTRCFCPVNSSKLRGRILAARGAEASTARAGLGEAGEAISSSAKRFIENGEGKAKRRKNGTFIRFLPPLEWSKNSATPYIVKLLNPLKAGGRR